MAAGHADLVAETDVGGDRELDRLAHRAFRGGEQREQAEREQVGGAAHKALHTTRAENLQPARGNPEWTSAAKRL
ncbi:MAG: hypothetical protein U1F87_00290 [Kiritimatiellia bacterium]